MGSPIRHRSRPDRQSLRRTRIVVYLPIDIIRMNVENMRCHLSNDRRAASRAYSPQRETESDRQREANEMFSVVFEVHPRKDSFDTYLGLAKDLKPLLQAVDGFIDNERFESTR